MIKGLKDLHKKWHKSILNDIKRLGLPEPDHESGFSMDLLKDNLSKPEFIKLNDWMDGQTCVLDDNLGVICYTHDVIRGLDYIRNGTKTYWD